jgi:DNA-binding MarR family transcriptional regulator
MQKDTHTTPDDFAVFLETFAAFTRSTHTLDAIQREADAELSDLIERLEKDYAAAKAATQALEAALVATIKLHPEWLNGKSSITTMHGTLASRSSKALQIGSELRTIALIKAQRPTEAATLIRQSEEVDREALEVLSDEELLTLDVLRDQNVRWTAKPATVTLGDAAKPKKGAVK